MLNQSSVRHGWRESVSLHHFQNCNTLIMNHFRNYGVEDEPRNQSHCSLVRGTTESLPITVSGEPANNFSALMVGRVFGVLSLLPTLTRTTGTFGSVGSTLTTVP